MSSTDQPSRPAPTVGADTEATPRPHLLLVEDEKPIARIVCTLLQRRGYTVSAAHDGLSGWSVFSENPSQFAALILDLDMPGISGQEFARRTRGQGFRLPIVIVSGRITDADRRMLEGLGIEHFVDKPFEPDDLYRAIDRALGRCDRA